MTIEDNVKICEALGLDAGKVKMLEIRIYPRKVFVDVTLSIEPDAGSVGKFEDVLKKYTLVETPDAKEEKLDTETLKD